MVILVAFLVALALGFVAGAVLGKTVVNEARLVGSRARLDAAFLEARVEAKRQHLEESVQESFQTVSKDVENIVKRLEQIEHAAISKVAAVLAPDAPRA